ncbi:IS481 family transposase [Streptomyces sp. KN37]|uniref:IS481 family transposase n=1 Tax=Streptomyces sp. KN37 TaxID=3090667 RepID=UPI002A751963|nr:IS481 family transposase [Streptomyces sp. KN37]WPO69572.1 IS481 family transposase [Streptomyces sp. KN37]WPO70914.1 IS481 family transposase [Streptomyces sp. KN37]WPO72203.1 IS481 family transposase [Streptomyces sp. KN37]WPO73288.1 IS481 family transposase [Streptomyces sp. KN37]WPO73579.1 IS481 family transposase [Streptomyces sp. KN37]
MSHRNARLTVHGRRILVERVLSGRPVAHVAAEMGISRPTAHKWVRRWRAEGEAGLADRSSRPRTTPHRTPATVETRVCRLRTDRKLGPARIGPILGLPASTVHRILARHGLNRLAWLDRPTGEPIRRYERTRPGELIHVDIKKLGNIPDGGGHKVMDRRTAMDNKITTTRERKSRKPVIGYSYIHSAVDDHSRLAYSEILPDERQHTAIAFWQRANTFFTAHGITVERVLTDNGACYKSKLFTQSLTSAGIAHKKIRPYRPQTNGKVERFNRTLLDEWAYLRPYTSNNERTKALADFLHTYNHHRCHTALDGHPPITRVNNAAGQYT